MSLREETARALEARCEIRFEVIRNDGTIKSLEQLTALKNIFAVQLPKMPREYIVRLVFDRRHVSLALFRGQDKILGGICFRPYRAQRFLEIAFCAVTSTEQVRGFGTRVMNHLKEHAKRDGILYFLTYADNYAIGYFKKQGFSKTVTLPRERWFGRIKDYDGGTLMECYVHPTIDFLQLSATLKRQRAFIEAELEARYMMSGAPPHKRLDDHRKRRKQITARGDDDDDRALDDADFGDAGVSGSLVVSSSSSSSGSCGVSASSSSLRLTLTAAAAANGSKKRRRPASSTENDDDDDDDANDDGGGFTDEDHNQEWTTTTTTTTGVTTTTTPSSADEVVPGTPPTPSLLDAIPGLRELGYTDAELRKLARPVDPDGAKRREDLNAAQTLLDRTRKHADAWPFHEPVDVAQVPDYLDVIKDPIDLKTMQTDLKAGKYAGFKAVKRDLLRMLDNCRKYNVAGLYVKTADSLEKVVVNEARKLEDALDRFNHAYDQEHDLLS